MRFDLIIANPPYGKEGRLITDELASHRYKMSILGTLSMLKSHADHMGLEYAYNRGYVLTHTEPERMKWVKQLVLLGWDDGKTSTSIRRCSDVSYMPTRDWGDEHKPLAVRLPCLVYTELSIHLYKMLFGGEGSDGRDYLVFKNDWELLKFRMRYVNTNKGGRTRLLVEYGAYPRLNIKENNDNEKQG